MLQMAANGADSLLNCDGCCCGCRLVRQVFLGQALPRFGCCYFHGRARPSAVAPPQVGTSLCNFLTLTATFGRSADGPQTAELLLQFGSAAHLRTASGSAGGACEPVADAAAAAASKLEWPALGGVWVLGWRAQVLSPAVELVQRADECNLAVTDRQALPASAAAAGPDGLHIDLSSLNLQLKCGMGVRISWSEAAAPATAGGAAASA